MKINFNKGKIIKLLSLVSAGIVIYVGSQIAFNSSKKEKENRQSNITKVTTSSENKCTELTIDGVTYMLPAGFDRLEVINGHVYAVNSYLIKAKDEDVIIEKDENGNDILVAPSGFYLVDGEAYREIVQYGEPDTMYVEEIKEEVKTFSL